MLLATGHRPNAEVGCVADVGITVDVHGYIITVDKHIETWLAGVFCCGRRHREPCAFVYTCTAAHEGSLAAENAIGARPVDQVDCDNGPLPLGVVCTDPQVAGVATHGRACR